jgi:hypothetical protein
VLGPLTLDSRDYSHVNSCDLDPAPLAQDLERVNGFLSRYLDMTSAGKEGHWSDEQREVLERSPQVVPRIARSEQKALADLPACPPPEALGFAELSRQGSELSRQALLRVDESKGILDFLSARRALDAWTQTEARERATAREALCPHKLRAGKVPPIYYAAENESFETHFLFCDDVEVVRSIPHPAPAVKRPAEHAAKGAPKDDAYLSAATAFDAAQIRHAPKLPGTEPKAPEAPEKDPEI